MPPAGEAAQAPLPLNQHKVLLFAAVATPALAVEQPKYRPPLPYRAVAVNFAGAFDARFDAVTAPHRPDEIMLDEFEFDDWKYYNDDFEERRYDGTAGGAAVSGFLRTDAATLFVERTGADGVARVACVFADVPPQRKPHINWGSGNAGDEHTDSMSEGAEWTYKDDLDVAAKRRLFRLRDVRAHVPPYAHLAFLSDTLPAVYDAEYEGMGDEWRMPSWCTLHCTLARASKDVPGARLEAALSFRCGVDDADYAEEHDEPGGLPLSAAQLVHMLRPLNWR